MKKEITRRDLLGYGAVVGGTLATGAILGGGEAEAAKKKSTWDYHLLDPVETEYLGYQGFYEGRCSWGSFKSIIGQLGDKHGEPYKSFPFEMMKYGTAGVAFWGSLCGALNGSAAAIGLLHTGKTRDRIISSLYAWYEKTKLPIYSPQEPVYPCKMDTSISHSVLCHRSVGQWCKVSGNKFTSKEKLERCARVVGDVAKKAVTLLNAERKHALKTIPISTTATECLSCHGANKKEGDALVKMDCAICHGDKLHHLKKF